MYRAVTILILLAGRIPSAGAADPAPLDALSQPQLEQRLTEIDAELEQLAAYTLRGGAGSVGYRSGIHRQPDVRETVRVEWDAVALVDQIVLVPVLYRDAATGVGSEGFPVSFRILAGTGSDTNELAAFTAEDHLLPRIAPLVVSFPPVNASWVAIEATRLSSAFNRTDRYNFQLSELLVFSGMENVALPLQQPLGSPPPDVNPLNPRQHRFLTDGFTPYLMDAARGSTNDTQLIQINSPEPPSLTMDLGSTVPINQVNWHTAGVGRSIPMIETSSWAVPRRVRVTGATRSDFVDERFLCEYNQQSIYDNGPIITRRFAEARCRYIRFVILDAQPVVSVGGKAKDIAFAEIEVLSNNQNMARGAPVIASSNLEFRRGTLERLTDGFNYYGQILPFREWMNQLARRHDLEKERPLVVAELNRGYARQQTKLWRMGWLAILLATGIVISILIGRLKHQRQMERLRTRLAADLHDELGANLHTIGLLSDAANASHDSEEEWKMLHQRIRQLTERTGTAIRHCSSMVSTDDLYLGLVEDMKRAAERIMAKFEHAMEIDGEEFLDRLKPRRRIDLFLFYKECLMNICRHSDATRFDTQLTASPKEIVLTIRDNGKGLSEGPLPTSLKRRARMLKAKLTSEVPASGGTEITLRLRNGKARHTMRKEP